MCPLWAMKIIGQFHDRLHFLMVNWSGATFGMMTSTSDVRTCQWVVISCLHTMWSCIRCYFRMLRRNSFKSSCLNFIQPLGLGICYSRLCQIAADPSHFGFAITGSASSLVALGPLMRGGSYPLSLRGLMLHFRCFFVLFGVCILLYIEVTTASNN